MMDDIKPEVIKKTQETLGKFIKKPVLTEKLLMKPPFRFLHDICTAAMRETGYFEGVLSPADCKADNIKDKDGKIAFLHKVIGAVETTNGIKLAIKPNKVVAGHEPTRTNEFLQALGKALEKQSSLNGNAAKPKSESNQVPGKQKNKSTKRPEKEDQPTIKKKTSSTRLARTERSSENVIREEPKTKAGQEKISPYTKQEKTKKNEIASPRDVQKSIDKPKDEIEDKGTPSKPKELNSLEHPADNSEEKTEQKPEYTEKDNAAEPEPIDTKRPISPKLGQRKQRAISEVNEKMVPLESSPNREADLIDSTKLDRTSTKSPTDIIVRPESSFARLKKQNSGSTVMPPNYSIKDTDGAEDSSPISRPITGIRPTTARPASARPAAPRIRDRGEIAIHEDVVKQSMGNVQIITDTKENNEQEEDENVVVVETDTELITDGFETKNQLETISDQSTKQEEHGLLVEQILETQKELDQSRLQIIDNKTSGKTEIEWKSSRNKEAIDREVKKLRFCIQNLTRSVNPLGKLLDILQEDIDIMLKELETWREMNSNLEGQISQERTLTEQSVEPLKVHLKGIQQNIDQQIEQMTVVKANILRNDQKIHRLLMEMK